MKNEVPRLPSAPRAPALRRRQRGVTLVEITLVLIIASVLVAIAVPNFGGAQEQLDLEEVQSRLASDLRIMRQDAMRCGNPDNDPPSISFDGKVNGNEYDWRINSSGCPGGIDVQRRCEDFSADFNCKNNFTIDYDETIEFKYPYGEVDSEHEITISSGDEEVSICLDGDSSAVQSDECS
ncbi:MULTISPECIES: Tfp pilus assembly protein FimT/FimU [Halorhodospira]|uniref:pilus assembly FimT family protein n=1 Tax=Halorhodospira TaxID=85108 RepID=UPI001EE8F57C|nr:MULTISPECIES: prepilin-type N-terminal cleavage/methylation domain-containing protein [Halorhodospira]MCG5528640.1 prepilin-type N-terminal cleavage/methylation domain-containing protein [Halorhodospira halophila]MCG5543967.1 prepilin-type N-terminal cleavage/methylation domain-containing protein [Halorhodospira sp. 9628]